MVMQQHTYAIYGELYESISEDIRTWRHDKGHIVRYENNGSACYVGKEFLESTSKLCREKSMKGSLLIGYDQDEIVFMEGHHCKFTARNQTTSEGQKTDSKCKRKSAKKKQEECKQ